MFPLLLDSENLLIKKKYDFFFSTHYLFKAYTNCIWKDHTHISDCLWLTEKEGRYEEETEQNSIFFFLITVLSEWSECLSKEEAPTESERDFWHDMGYTYKWCKPGTRNICAAECIAVAKMTVRYWNQPHDNSGLQQELVQFSHFWICNSPSTTALHKRDGPWNKCEGYAKERSQSSVFQWGNWGTEGLLCPTSSVW